MPSAVEIIFRGQSASAVGAARQAEAAIGRVGSRAGVSQRLLAGMGGAMVTTLRRGTTAAVLFGATASVAVAKTGIQFEALREQAETAFTTMLGSGEKAKAFLDELASFAARTPFEFPDLLRASQRLLAMGFQAQEIIPHMTAIGDAVAALGGGSFEIDRVVTALGQMQAKGKVSAEEMMQLTEIGIPAWQMLAKTLGVDVAKAMDMVQKRQVDADQAIQGFMTQFERRWGGMMDKQSKGLLGLFSTAKDLFRQMSDRVMRPFFDDIKRGLGRVNDLMADPAFLARAEALGQRLHDALAAGFDRLQASWPQIRRGFEDLAVWAAQAAPVVRDVFLGLADGARSAGGALGVLGGPLRAAWGLFNMLVSALGGWRDAAAQALRVLIALKAAQLAYNAAVRVQVIFEAVRALVGFARAAQTAARAQIALNTAMRLSPWGLVAGAIAGVVTYLSTAKDELKSFEDQLESVLSTAADRAAAAVQEVAASHRDAATAAGDMKDAHLAVERAQLNLTRATEAFHEVQRRAKPGSVEYREALLSMREAYRDVAHAQQNARAAQAAWEAAILGGQQAADKYGLSLRQVNQNAQDAMQVLDAVPFLSQKQRAEEAGKTLSTYVGELRSLARAADSEGVPAARNVAAAFAFAAEEMGKVPTVKDVELLLQDKGFRRRLQDNMHELGLLPKGKTLEMFFRDNGSPEQIRALLELLGLFPREVKTVVQMKDETKTKIKDIDSQLERLRKSAPTIKTAMKIERLEAERARLEKFLGELRDAGKKVAEPKLKLLNSVFTERMKKANQALTSVTAVVAKPKVTVNTTEALTGIRIVTDALTRLDGKVVTTFVNTVFSSTGGGGAIRRAMGGFVPLFPGSRPGVDSVPALLAPGEVVLNRAQQARLGGPSRLARMFGFSTRGVPGVGRFADGGIVADDAPTTAGGGGGASGLLAELDRVARAIRGVGRAGDEASSRLSRAFDRLEARIEKLGPEGGKASERLSAALDRVKSKVERLTSAFDTAFQRFEDRALTAFDRLTEGHLTPAEQQLRDMQQAHDAQQRAQEMADAQAALAAAQTEEERRDARQRIADLMYADQVAALEAQAALERREYEDQRANQREHLEAQLETLKGALERGELTHKEYHRRLMRLLRRHGIDLRTAGGVIGDQFVRGLGQSLRAVERFAEAIARAVRALIQAAGSGGGGGGGTGGLARGGVTRQAWTLVGEEGPELARLPVGSRVYPAGQTRRLIDAMLRPAGVSQTALASAGSPGSRGGDTYQSVTVHVRVAGSVVTERDIAQNVRKQLMRIKLGTGKIGLA